MVLMVLTLTSASLPAAASATTPNERWIASHQASPSKQGTSRGYGYGYGGHGYGYGGYGGYGYGGYGGGCGYDGYSGYGYGGYGCPPHPSYSSCGSGDSAVISNGLIQLGVCKLGELNVKGGGSPSAGQGSTTVGLRYAPLNLDAISPGCLCEGWGVADATTHTTGYADQETGTAGLVPVSFTHDARSAASTVEVGGKMRVTQSYRPSNATSYLYEDTVTIKNISSAPVEPRYRRVMDWDVEPTAFNEYVTIDRGDAANILFTSDDGFATPNPLGGRPSLRFTGEAVDNGPSDHGALFDFGFPTLAPGATRTFRVFYGAAPGEAQALAATEAVGAEAYSLGQPSTADGPTLGKPVTFVFAFSGVGGTPIRNALSLSPTSARKHLGDTHRIVVSAADASGKPLTGRSIVWRVTGANTQSGRETTTAEGRAAIEYVGAAAGDDSVLVFIDEDGDGTRDPGEPQAEAEVRWEPDVVASPAVGKVPNTPTGAPVSLASYINPSTGLTYFTIPAGQAAQFPGGCVPFTASTRLVAGKGTIVGPHLLLRRRDGTQASVEMTTTGGVSEGTLPCAASGDLAVEYDLVETGTTHHYVIPLGGLVLVDPQGVVYDRGRFEAAVSAGRAEADARADAAVSGATVTLQRFTGDQWVDVPSGDPGISPNVNPEVTGADGKYAWDVSAGKYRVVVKAAGFDLATSREVTVPPPVLDLHVALTKPGAATGPGISTTTATAIQSAVTKGIDVAKISAALDARLKPTGRGAKLAQVAKKRGFTTTVALAAPGKLTLSWYTRPKGKKGKRTLVARGVAQAAKASTVKVTLKLTAPGRKLVAQALQRKQKLKLQAQALFESPGAAPILRTRSITLSR